MSMSLDCDGVMLLVTIMKDNNDLNEHEDTSLMLRVGNRSIDCQYHYHLRSSKKDVW